MNGISAAHQGHCCDVCLEGQVCPVADRPFDFGDVHERLRVGRCRDLGSSGRCPLPRSVAALPISICPQAISNACPSSAVDLVRPVIASLVAVYVGKGAAEHGRISGRFSTKGQAREVSTLIRELADIVPAAICSENHDNAGELVSHDRRPSR
jgi:hypothetical protein